VKSFRQSISPGAKSPGKPQAEQQENIAAPENSAKPAAQTASDSPAQPEPASSQPALAEPKAVPQEQPAEDTEPVQANQATDVFVPDPIAVPSPKPEVETQPEADPLPETAKTESESANEQPVTEQPAELPAPEPKEQTAPEPSADQADPEAVPAEPDAPVEQGNAAPSEPISTDGADAEEEGQGGSPEKAEPGPPPAPPGPSAHELSLLGEYGDASLRRILSQARNPEARGSGTVVFEFEVARDGHLVEVRLVKSSGHQLLDDDVIDATKAAFNDDWEIIPFPDDITVDSWVFKRSVKYPLW
jgi:protein TonB